jgi:formiminotetrahydrofolate cyclodeaminase
MTANSSLVTFLDDLASERPTPGGGGAAAVSGAIGAALVSMVANLTIGKKNYEAVREDLEAVNAKAEVLRAELIRRFAAAAGKDRAFSRRRHGVTPV